MAIITKETQYSEVGHLYEHIQALRVRQALLEQALVPIIDFSIEFETSATGRVSLNFNGTKKATNSILKTLEETDKALLNDDVYVGLALAHIETEYKGLLQFKKDALRGALKIIAAIAWKDIDSLNELAAPFRSRQGSAADPVLSHKRQSAGFTTIAVDIFLNDDGYTKYPATIFVFDELARIYLECLFSACLHQQIPVYWRRVESRRNKKHVRQTLVLTAKKGVKLDDIRDAAQLQGSFLGEDVFNHKFQEYIESFIKDGDTRLENSYQRLYRDYGLSLGKHGLRCALKEEKLGNITEALGVEIRVTS